MGLFAAVQTAVILPEITQFITFWYISLTTCYVGSMSQLECSRCEVRRFIVCLFLQVAAWLRPLYSLWLRRSLPFSFAYKEEVVRQICDDPCTTTMRAVFGRRQGFLQFAFLRRSRHWTMFGHVIELDLCYTHYYLCLTLIHRENLGRFPDSFPIPNFTSYFVLSLLFTN